MQGNPHMWKVPPAGQSPLPVCTVCGERKTAPYETEPCAGHGGATNEVRTLDEYEPFK